MEQKLDESYGDSATLCEKDESSNVFGRPGPNDQTCPPDLQIAVKHSASRPARHQQAR